MNKYNWDLDKIREYVKSSINLSEVLSKLGIPKNNSKTLRKILDKNNIDYSHFTGRAREYNNIKISIEDYTSNKRFINSSDLKKKLIKAGLKFNKCEECGLEEWRGNPITCQLHHVDGNPKNNSLENLKMLCPNCHSQTDNYCGNANKSKVINTCKDCGKPICREAKYCSICYHKYQRKVEKPDKEELLSKYLELGKNMLELGKFYGVTDNAVRKWLKSYKLPYTKLELEEYLKNNSNN